MPCFWVSSHCPGAPAPVSDHDGLDAKPATWEPGQSWAPLSVPTLEDAFLRGFGLVYKHVKMRLGWGFESCSYPAESEALTLPTQGLPASQTHDSLREDAYAHRRKNNLRSACSTISLHSACGLYNNRPCLPRDTASVGESCQTVTLSSPSQCLPSMSSPGKRARKEREVDPQCRGDAAGTQQRTALGEDAPFLPCL